MGVLKEREEIVLDYGWHDPEDKYAGWSSEEREKDWLERLEIARESTRKTMAKIKPPKKREE
jgi:hypothetical protein